MAYEPREKRSLIVADVDDQVWRLDRRAGALVDELPPEQAAVEQARTIGA